MFRDLRDLFPQDAKAGQDLVQAAEVQLDQPRGIRWRQALLGRIQNEIGRVSSETLAQRGWDQFLAELDKAGPA